MSDFPTVVYWRHRPVEELTREELIEAVKDAAAEIDRMRAALGNLVAIIPQVNRIDPKSPVMEAARAALTPPASSTTAG